MEFEIIQDSMVCLCLKYYTSGVFLVLTRKPLRQYVASSESKTKPIIKHPLKNADVKIIQHTSRVCQEKEKNTGQNLI